MSFSDRIKQAARAAKEAAAEHKQQVERAINEAGQMADEQTGGRYASQIAKARAGADRYVEGLQPERPAEEPGERGSVDSRARVDPRPRLTLAPV